MSAEVIAVQQFHDNNNNNNNNNGFGFSPIQQARMSSSSDEGSDSDWTRQKSPPKRFRKVAGGGGEEDGRKSKNSSTFIQKVFEMANCKKHSHAIGFSEDGLSLEIRNGSLLGPVLSQYFRHGHTSSFIRQLNNYGFKTISSPSSGNDRHVFAHPNFKRDDRALLESITRKAAMREKKKSKADVIKDLQQREAEQRARMMQLEARHHDLMQRTLMLDSENRSLRQMFQALNKSGEKMDLSALSLTSSMQHQSHLDNAFEFSSRPSSAPGHQQHLINNMAHAFDRIASPFGPSNSGGQTTNPNSPVFVDSLQHLQHQGHIQMDHLNMDIVMSPMESTTPTDMVNNHHHDGMLDGHHPHHQMLEYESMEHHANVPQA